MPNPFDPREKALRLFEFVQAFNERRNPPVRDLRRHEWSLWLDTVPDHEAVELTTVVDENVEDESDDAEGQSEAESDIRGRVILRCGRPDLTTAPTPPEALEDWLAVGWHDARKRLDKIESRNLQIDGEQIVEYFHDSGERVEAYNQYEILWGQWAETERLAIGAAELFQSLYELHGRIRREEDNVEVVLADGILSWRQGEDLYHPMLTTPLTLEFNSSIPEFVLIEAGSGTDFYYSLLNSIEGIDGALLGSLRSEVTELGLHPLGNVATPGFLRSLVARLAKDGTYVGDGDPGPRTSAPRLGRRPLIILRKRTTGLAQAIAAIVEAIKNGATIPEPILRIVGVDETPSENDPDSPLLRPFVDANADDEILFTLDANPEQLAIARKLDRQDGVLVQGPPGTGKTHTIANIIGHLLAGGKSVLVTSHTAKALKVLKEKVLLELQPLCLSVVDTREDDAALKFSIDGIVERLGVADESTLARDITVYESQRKELIRQLDQHRHALKNARLDEYRPVGVGEEVAQPIAAAKLVAAGVGHHDWIPGTVKYGESFPFTTPQLARLYATNLELKVDEEQRIASTLPDVSHLPSPGEFASLVQQYRSLTGLDLEVGRNLWEKAEEGHTHADAIEALDVLLRTALSVLESAPEWALRIVEIGLVGMEHALWEGLIADVESAQRERAAIASLLVAYSPVTAPKLSDKSIRIYEELLAEVVRSGKVPNFITLFTRGDWKIAIEESRINGNARPSSREHFEALLARAKFDQQWQALRRRWESQVVAIGGPRVEDNDDVDAVARHLPSVRAALTWSDSQWALILQQFSRCGLRWHEVLSQTTYQQSGWRQVERIRNMAGESLIPILAAETNRRRLEVVKDELAAVRKRTNNWSTTGLPGELRSAVEKGDEHRYDAIYSEISRLYELQSKVAERTEFLEQLEAVAPEWASAVRLRTGRHGESTPPPNVQEAWTWAQFEHELARRSRISLAEISRQIEVTRDELKRTTSILVERRAWLHQKRRMTDQQRRALNGFMEAKRQFGKGTGKRAARLLKAQRQFMSEARSAVPVWITSIAKAVSVFSPSEVSFDVVIVDEASQSDVTALVALFLGKKVLVVGDNEQVSPADVGQTIESTQQLVDAFLKEIPNKDLYDGKLSLYAIAEWSFGGSIMLLEHFRSVPDIITFSNALSYGGKIKPLREITEKSLLPSVIEQRVDGMRTGDVNELEATSIVALVKACIENDAYQGKTIGVISLLADSQAQRIEQLLYRVLPPEEIEDRRIIVGSAPQFQGDERDVMFISVVNSIDESVRLVSVRPMQQRYNVAASRARDQMWIVHSLDTGVLGADDLRRKLIEHARDPSVLAREAKAALARAESDFEEEVIKRLASAGYHLISNPVVGGYRIDIVVYGADGRTLAVECDGERFHGEDALQYDMQRQANLERVGWRFARIRGSAFYRNKDAAMTQVFDRLAAVGIEPLVGQRPDRRHSEETPLLREIRRRSLEIRAEIEEALEAGELLISQRGTRSAPIAKSDPSMGAQSATIAGDSRDNWSSSVATLLEQPSTGRPMIEFKESIDAHSTRSLNGVISWLVSTNKYKSDEELARAVTRELGYQRFGSKLATRLLPLARRALRQLLKES